MTDRTGRRARLERMLLLLLLASLGGAWIVYSQDERQAEASFMTEAPMVGHLAPLFTLPTPDGRQLSLAQFVQREGEDGVPVILNFWASWCGPCRVETPFFDAISRRYQGQIGIMGINQGETAPTIADFGVSFGLGYPLLVDADNQVNQAYQVRNLPTTIFIDGRGVVREVYVGAISQGVLADRVETLLRAGE